MVQPTGDVGPSELHLGEGEFPDALDRVNFGAFLLSALWAPWHGLWGWFLVFVALEILESIVGLTHLRFVSGTAAQLAVMVAFRVVYWTVTIAFALRANRLVWARACKRAVRSGSASELHRPAPVVSYVSGQRVWAVAGLVLLAASPLSLLVGGIGNRPGALVDVATTAGTQAVLLGAMFVYDRMRMVRRLLQS